MFNCVICAGELKLVDPSVYNFNLVTSDCRIWGERAELGYCTTCGLVQRPRTVQWQEQCNKIYSTYEAYRQGLKEEQKIFNTQGLSEARSSRLLRYFFSEFNISKGKWLDYGCGDGSFLSALSSMSLDLQLAGFDVSSHNRDKVEESGAKFYSNLSCLDGKYDVISLVHVLEHFVDPINCLVRLVDYLEDDGLILVQVPSYKINPFDLAIYDHASFFSEETLEHTLHCAGFKICKMTDAIILKEVTTVCRNSSSGKISASSKLSALGTSELVSMSKQNIEASLDILSHILNEALSRSQSSQINVFGTSIGASWLTANLDSRSIQYYLDEDTSRVGHMFFEKEIIAPTLATIKDTVFPLPPRISDSIMARFHNERKY
ncbi:class I SAM-dependent methyltransferase [bacterium]|nr:class I SAM-dependent methyltransferase [bacterium]